MPAATRQPVVLITGASAGLGLALSKRLLTGRWRLILTARESSLSRFGLAGIHETPTRWIRALDVTSAEQREAVVDEATARWGGIDVLINNAGVAYRAVCEHVDAADQEEQLNVNYLGPMEMIRLVLPAMRERHDGRIINVSSVGGMMAMPTMALYSASKFALEGATEALWYEVRPFGIRVSLVQPGFIHSDSFRNTRYTQRSQAAVEDSTNPYAAHYQHMAGFIARCMKQARVTPETVASKIVSTMTSRHPPLRVAGTDDAHLFGWLRRILPRRIYHEVLYRSLPGIGKWGQHSPDLAPSMTSTTHHS